MSDNESPLSENRAVDEDSKDLKKGDVKDDELTPQFWFGQLDRSKRAAKHHLKATDEAYREYMGSFTEELTLKAPIKQPETRFPIFWSSVRTIQPALYSATPIPQSARLFDSMEDEVSRLGTVCLERLAKFLIKRCSFDRTETLTRDDFIMGGKATNKVCYYAELETPEEEEYEESEKVYYVLTNDPQGNQIFINDRGEQLADGIELEQDEHGYYSQDAQVELKREYVTLEPVSYRDIRHSPNARHWDEVDWVAFRSYLNKADIRKRFGDDIAEKIPFTTTLASVRDKNKKDEVEAPFASVWDIWDRETHKVYFVAEGFEDDFLEPPKDDPYGLPGFFPCPSFILGTLGPEDLYPVPDYIQLRPLILQLHALSKRLKTLVRATRRRGLFDNSIEELKSLASDTDDAEFLGVSNWSTIMSKGGLDNLVKYFPNEEIANTAQLIFQVFQQYQDMFNQIWGIPDILRGTSDPNETAAAQQIKGKFASLRFSAVQRDFQRLVRDDIELMCDIALSQFEDHTLMEIMGFRFMDQSEQQSFPLMLDLLRDKEERPVRLEIQTDSTIQMNEDEDLSRAQQVAGELLQSFAQIVQVSQGQQPIMAIGLKVMLMVLRKMPDGKLIENDLEQTIQQLLTPPPPGPPPPDPKMEEVQGKMQIEQQKADADIKIQQQRAETDIQIAQQKSDSDMRLAQDKASQQAQLMQLDAQHDAYDAKLKMQLEQMKAQMQMQLERERMQMEAHVKMVEAKFDLVINQMNQKAESRAKRITLETHPTTGHRIGSIEYSDAE